MDTAYFKQPCTAELTMWQAAKVIAVSTTLAVTLPLILYLHLDYLAFLALGPGGTPSTLIGFFKLKMLSFFIVQNPHQPPPIRGIGYLKALVPRKGHRPEIRGIAPQRQITDKANKAVFEQLTSGIEKKGLKTDSLCIDTSRFEKHCNALFYSTPCKASEICHAHPSDGSLHMVLHPADSKIVFEGGWGERHPLSRGGWFERFVPEDFVFIYAPRDEGEIEIVLNIARSAASYVANKTRESMKNDQANDSPCKKT